MLRPGLVAKDLPADLDDVVLKALCKEPEGRYQTVAEFADDVRRALENRPVTARQNSVGYRARKFIVRNRLQVAMAVVVAAALIGGLVVSLAQTRRARAERAVADSQRQIALHERAEAEAARDAEDKQRARADDERKEAVAQRGIAVDERDRAEHEKALADQRLNDILQLAGRTLFDVHDAIAPLPGATEARKKIVQTTLDYLKTMEKNLGNNDAMREVLTEAYYKVALIQGDPHGASLQDSASAKKSLLKAQEILMPAYRRKPDDSGMMLRLIEVQSSLAELMEREGHEAEAIQLNLDLLPVTQRLAHAKDCNLVCETQESAIENSVAGELLTTDPRRALEHSNHGAELARALVVKYPKEARLKQSLAVLTAVSGAAYRNIGDLDKASEYYRQSIEAREELLKADPNNVVIRRNLLVACGNYAMLLGVPTSVNIGRPVEARKYADRAVTIARELVLSDPKNVTARRDLAIILGRAGMIDPAPGETALSLAMLQEAAGLIEPIAMANPKALDLAEQLADILDVEALRLHELGRNEEAIAMYRKSMAAIEAFAATPKSQVMLEMLENEEGLALVYTAMGKKDDALMWANKAVAAAEKNAATPPVSDMRTGELGSAWSTLAIAQSSVGSTDEASRSAGKAMQAWESITNRSILTAFRKPMSDAQGILNSARVVAH